MIQTILPGTVSQVFVDGNISPPLSPTLFLRLYLVFSRRRLYRITVIEDFLHLGLRYLPQSGDTREAFHSRLPALIMKDPEADNLADIFLLSRGFFSQVDDGEDQFDVVGLPPPRLLLDLRLGWA